MPGALYYGKTPDAATCGNKCMLDGECTSWSWNRNNSSGEVGECWGIDGTRNAAQSGGGDSATQGIVSSYYHRVLVEPPKCTTPECLKAECLKKIESVLFPGETYVMIDEAKCEYSRRPSATCDMSIKVPRLRDVVPMPAVENANYLATTKCVPFDSNAKTGSFYYGKKDTADKCRIECETDSDCAAWTWNKNNGYQGMDTIGECWGTPTTSVYLGDMPGYVSGKT
jgi:hypothetical protein